MLGRFKRWLTGAAEPRAIGQLRTIANEHGGDLRLIAPSDHDTLTLARIEWIRDGRIYGGQARGATPSLAATHLLVTLRNAGLI